MIADRFRGSALIVALVLLVLISTVGIVFLVTSRSSREQSREATDQIRARVLAQSGLENASQLIRREIYRTRSSKSAADRPGDTKRREGVTEGLSNRYFYGRPVLSGSRSSPLFQPEVPLERAYWVSFSYDPDRSGHNWSVPISGTGTNRTGTDVRSHDDDSGDFRISSVDERDESDEGGEEFRKHFGISGKVPATYKNGHDVYSLRVEGSAGRILVQDTKGLQEGGYKRRLLDNLGTVLEGQLNGNIPSELGALFYRGIQQAGGDISNLHELLETDAFAEKRTLIRLLKGFIVTEGWVDSSTLNPGALHHPRADDTNLVMNSEVEDSSESDVLAQEEDRLDSSPPSRPEQYNGRKQDDVFIFPHIATFKRKDTLFPAFSPRTATVPAESEKMMEDQSPEKTQANVPQQDARVLQPRAPININSAPPAILQSVLMGVKAVYLQREQSAPSGMYDLNSPVHFMGAYRTVTVSEELAEAVTRRIRQWRYRLIQKRGYGIATHQELNHFLYALDSRRDLRALSDELYTKPEWKIPERVWVGMKDQDDQRIIRALQQALIANTNPNSRLSHGNPNFARGVRHGDVSKADLVQWTTEFNFTSNGIYRVESLGRVIGSPEPGEQYGALEAEAKISTYMKLYETFRISTQKDFLQNSVGPQHYGTTAEHTEQAAGRKNIPSSKVPVQYYPEPIHDLYPVGQSEQNLSHEAWKHRAVQKSARYDGYLMMPTKERIASHVRHSGTREVKAANYNGNPSRQPVAGYPGLSSFILPFHSSFLPDAYRWFMSPYNVYGTVDEGRRLVEPGSSKRDAYVRSGNRANELVNDGVFFHMNRRYGKGIDRSQHHLGAPSLSGGTDEYLRYNKHPLFDQSHAYMKEGTIQFWFKPSWFGTEFSVYERMQKQRSEARGFGRTETPRKRFSWKGIRTMVSAGHGILEKKRINASVVSDVFQLSEGAGGTSSFFVSKDRMALFTRPRLSRTNNEWRYSLLFQGLFKNIVHGANHSDDHQPATRRLPLTRSSVDPYIEGGWDQRSWFYPGRWHHVLFSWSNVTQRSLIAVDGVIGAEGRGIQSDPANASGRSSPPMNWSLFVGSNRFQKRKTNGYPSVANGTVDHLQIWPCSIWDSGGNRKCEKIMDRPGQPSSFVPLDRYPSRSVYRAKIGPRASDGTRQPINFDGTVMNMSWTAYLPDRVPPKSVSLKRDPGKYLTGCRTGVHMGIQARREEETRWDWNTDQSRTNFHPYEARNGRGIEVRPADGKTPNVQKGDQLIMQMDLLSTSPGRTRASVLLPDGQRKEVRVSTWRTESPLVDDVTLRVLRETPRIISRFYVD